MKIFLMILFFFAMCFDICTAQNTVAVKQSGHANKVSINQSGHGRSKRTLQDTVNCDDDALKIMDDGKNVISVKKEGGKKSYKTSGSSSNSFYLNQTEVNVLSFVNLWGLKDTVSALQQGSKNNIFIFLQSDSVKRPLADNINLSQRGRENSIVMDPCEEKEGVNSGRANHVNIKQKGNGNKVSISTEDYSHK